MTDHDAFVAAILAGDLDAAGVLADWLEDRGDPRGVLLRRRWRRWRAERRHAAEDARRQREILEEPLRRLRAAAEVMRRAGAEVTVAGEVSYSDNGAVLVDGRFRRYVRERFPTQRAES